MTTRLIEFRQLRGTQARWAEKNPVLDETEIGYEKDTGRFKMGDGVTPWSELLYFTPSSPDGPTSQELLDHINNLTPHPEYDDGPSLALLYENAKV